MITFNGVNLSTLGWTTTNISRSPSPILTINTRTAPNIVGSVFKSRSIGERDFEVELQYIGKTKAETYNKISSLVEILDTDEPQQLKFKDMQGGYFKAIVSNVEMPTQIMSAVKIGVTFKLCDPFFYLDQESTTQFNTKTGVVVNDQGKYHNWKISLQVQSQSTQVTATIGRTTLTFNGNFIAKDMIAITDAGVVTLNGTHAPHILSLDSRVHPMSLGDNTYTISGNAIMWVKIQGKKFY